MSLEINSLEDQWVRHWKYPELCHEYPDDLRFIARETGRTEKDEQRLMHRIVKAILVRTNASQDHDIEYLLYLAEVIDKLTKTEVNELVRLAQNPTHREWLYKMLKKKKQMPISFGKEMDEQYSQLRYLRKILNNKRFRAQQIRKHGKNVAIAALLKLKIVQPKLLLRIAQTPDLELTDEQILNFYRKMKEHETTNDQWWFDNHAFYMIVLLTTETKEKLIREEPEIIFECATCRLYHDIIKSIEQIERLIQRKMSEQEIAKFREYQHEMLMRSIG